jgi:hypothetical protein
MAFALNKNEFLLEEMDLYKGTVSAADDTLSEDTLLGYMDGEKKINVSDEFAEFFTGVPQVKVRSDLTKRKIVIEGNLKQFNPDVLELALNGEKTSDGSDSHVFLGSQPSVAETSGFWLKGRRVDGKTVCFVVRKGRIITDSIDITTGNNEYSSIPVKIEAEVDTDVADKQRDLCFVKFENVI